MSNRISKNLSHLRVSQNRTKIWVADQISKTESSIRNYESGKADPPVQVLQQYADLFGVWVGDLVGRDLWISPDGVGQVSDPLPGDARHHARVEGLLHSQVDNLEAQINYIERQLAALKTQMAGDASASDYFKALNDALKGLEKLRK